ncbi:C4-dicarboxylate transporter DctA [Parasediminibacterium sp. JCM 36343]|uniref:C4-dicarboxylate transporter DctA n=1 Tax=Parasediminibacterium sp. JCM 36343 TaxID=3374279 RepID=UPI0039799FD0
MKYLKQLYVQVLIGVVLGIAIGYFFPSLNGTGKIISEAYISLIKMLIAPLIFFTATIGIASSGNLGKAGRIGGKAILYFEIASTVAMFLGVMIVNILKPGVGISTQNLSLGSIESFVQTGKEVKWIDFFIHIIPSNVIDSFAKGDILQVLVFSVLFGIGLNKIGDAGKSVVATFGKINKVLFEVLNMITLLSPLGAFGGILYTVGKFGFATLFVLGKLMLTFYLAAIIFIFLVLGLVMRYYKLSILKLLAYIKEEILIVAGSFSSESVLSNLMYKLEEAGCEASVVGLVIPTGYSFNLDGTSIYLSMSMLFIAQVFNVPLDVWQQLTIVGVLMITSKGAGGITGSGFIVLASSLAAIKIIPVEGLALLIGVDRFMSQCRALTNMIGNTVATVVIARNENMLDMAVYNKMVEGKTVVVESTS